MDLGKILINENGDGVVNFQLFQYNVRLKQLEPKIYYDGRIKATRSIGNKDIHWESGEYFKTNCVTFISISNFNALSIRDSAR